MKLTELFKSVSEHSGEFFCEQINNKTATKVVAFGHAIELPMMYVDLPRIGRLVEFYETFGSIEFYLDPKSGDAARFIASPSQWSELEVDFAAWMDGLNEDERQELLPNWIDSCLVIGETPHSGNYILMATDGDEAGCVFEFDHDGFEFPKVASDIVEYVENLLNPIEGLLTNFASHMRFIEQDNPMSQWWIREMRDNKGCTITTHS